MAIGDRSGRARRVMVAPLLPALLAGGCSPEMPELRFDRAVLAEGGSGGRGASESSKAASAIVSPTEPGGSDRNVASLSLTGLVLRELDRPSTAAEPLPTVHGTIDRRVPEWMKLPELDPSVRVEFWAGGAVHIHQPPVNGDRFVATPPAAFAELPRSKIWWRAFATSEGERVLPLDVRWRRLSEEREAELRWIAPPATFVRVVAAEAGVPLDALGESWEFVRQGGSFAFGIVRGEERSERCIDGGAWWTEAGGFKVQAGIADWWAGEIELTVQAAGRVERTLEIDARGGGAREVRLWPATEVEIVAVGEEVMPSRNDRVGVWLRSGRATHGWRSAPVKFIGNRASVTDVPVGPVELVRQPGLREGVRPIVLASGHAEGSECSRIKVASGDLAQAARDGFECGGNWSNPDEPAIARIAFELHDGETRVPLPWATVRPRPRWRGESRDGSACSFDQPFWSEGTYSVEFELIDGFEPIAPIEFTVNSGDRRTIVIPLTRERW
ncbi:MAG: hypothetical protein JNL90_15705 [Planctomycetes bacterium]|nr:hypothetical protein [Planctomycetota bacterium]